MTFKGAALQEHRITLSSLTTQERKPIAVCCAHPAWGTQPRVDLLPRTTLSEAMHVGHDRRGDHAVHIEPGLRPRSRKNGNISNARRRLSAIPLGNCPNWESGDTPPIYKSPPLAGISGTTEGQVSRRRTAWLGREDSNLRMVESKSTALPLGDAPKTGTRQG